MIRNSLLITLALTLSAVAAPPASQPTTKPVLKIIPGKVIVPTDAMRRIWGELISIDLKTRTGTFRKEGTDEVMHFTVLPYAELLHHAAFGDLDDFRVSERAIFRLHRNDQGQWVWLTYIQDEMNMLNGHKEYFYVDRIDPAKGQIEYTQANFDKSYVRAKNLILETDAQTHFWKNGEPATFGDIHVGDKIRAKTHGIGAGVHHVAWDVFLDDASLQKLQKEQQAAHAARMAKEGLPGYVDAVSPSTLALTLFWEAREQAKELKAGQSVKVAPAGIDRVAGAPIEAKIDSVKPEGPTTKVTLTLAQLPKDPFEVTGLARLWPVK